VVAVGFTGLIACNWVGCIRCSCDVSLARKDGVAKGYRRSCALVPNGLFTWLPTVAVDQVMTVNSLRADYYYTTIRNKISQSRLRAVVRVRNTLKNGAKCTYSQARSCSMIPSLYS
jgi:hypothetical protein